MAVENEILDRVHDLPSLPSSATQIITLLSGGESGLDEVELIVRNDEAIAMTVLKYANSPRFGRPGRVFSLRESISRLGTKLLMQIALQQQTAGIFADAGTSYGLRRGSLWRGTLSGAIAAETIAHDTSFPDPELVYLCGLFRDIGKIVIDRYASSEAIAHAGELIEPRTCFLEAERAAFGADHAEIGSELASRWGLPKRISTAIAHHHNPPSEPPDHDVLFDIVHAADVICLWTGLATGHDGLQYPLVPHVRDGLLGTRERAEYYMTTMWDRFTEMEAQCNNSSNREKSA